MTVSELKQHFYKGKANAYAWPGGYPVYFITSDGASLCSACVTKERAQIFRSTHERAKDGWAIAGVDCNYEDDSLFCEHCSKRIESAYNEPETEEPRNPVQGLIELVLRVSEKHERPLCGVCHGNGVLKIKRHNRVNGKSTCVCLACSGTGVQQWTYQN
jgi:hypothetical protein